MSDNEGNVEIDATVDEDDPPMFINNVLIPTAGDTNALEWPVCSPDIVVDLLKTLNADQYGGNKKEFWKSYPSWEKMSHVQKGQIQQKLANYEVDWLPGGFGVCGFIDDHCFKTCRPSTKRGDYQAHLDALELQQVFYNGWKSLHGLKFQTFDLPNGMTADMWGPRSLRGNDLLLLTFSQLNERLRECQEMFEKWFKCYADSIFPMLDFVRSSHKGANLSERHVLENWAMKKVRVPIEWHYGDLASLYPFIDYKNNMKLMQQPVELIYFAASLLHNCHTCLYGNNTSEYFNCKPPSLENFMRMES
jgi:hypothetical protein